MNLVRFRELADGVDDGTWMHHLRRGDYSAWMRTAIKDSALADEVAQIESAEDTSPAASRRRALESVRRRYSA